jgi:hypothetical protein
MRRWLSIFLILFWGLSPLAATLSSSAESRLPICCRRQGVHHCAMSASTALVIAESASGKPIVTAPLTCPYFPGYNLALTPTLALAASPIGLPAPLAQFHSPAAARSDAPRSQIRTRAGRGPPGFSLA